MTPTITDDYVESAIAAGLQAANHHMAMDADWLRLFARGVLEHAAGSLANTLQAAKPRLTTALIKKIAGETLPRCVECGGLEYHTRECSCLD